jgi:hypothetical protein
MQKHRGDPHESRDLRAGSDRPDVSQCLAALTDNLRQIREGADRDEGMDGRFYALMVDREVQTVCARVGRRLSLKDFEEVVTRLTAQLDAMTAAETASA